MLLEYWCLMKTNWTATFLFLKRELTVNYVACENALTGGMEKESAWDYLSYSPVTKEEN